MFERSLEAHDVGTRPVYFSSLRAQRNCLRRGVGLALIPRRAVARDLERGTLRQLHWDPAPDEAMVLCITHVEKWRSPLLKEFLRIAREVVVGG